MAKAMGPRKTRFTVSETAPPEDYWLMILLTDIYPTSDVPSTGSSR
jgi:hypothetical protein